MAATPAGSDKTPDPTHPLIRLKAAEEIVCSFDLKSSLLSLLAVVAAVEDAFIRALIPLPLFPTPRGKDRDVLLAAVRDFVFMLSVVETARIVDGTPIKKALDDVTIASMKMGRMAMELMTFIVV